ncbi:MULTISPECIES: hypothetical protein [Butyricimonas]|uniref:hypothetical protein n=1 Tax=Butyricimonas TaxID=574697 RepID=UPI0007FB518D|nr:MULTISPECIES: hypothetical protein [Butyricimonas]
MDYYIAKNHQQSSLFPMGNKKKGYYKDHARMATRHSTENTGEECTIFVQQNNINRGGIQTVTTVAETILLTFLDNFGFSFLHCFSARTRTS